MFEQTIWPSSVHISQQDIIFLLRKYFLNLRTKFLK